MTTFVLVPGFWLGGWAWRDVALPLQAAGHEVHAVTLTGLAERAHLGGPGTDAEAHVDDVVAVLEAGDLHDVVLAGHSGAGPVVAAAAERVRGRVARLVYVDSGPLPDGMAPLDLNPPDVRARIKEQIAARGGWYPLPSWADLEEGGDSTAGIDDDARERMARLASPHPGAAVAGSVRRGVPDSSLPKDLVACTFTAAQVQELVASGFPAFTELASPEWSVHELPTGHWPMFSRPADLAALLAGLAGSGSAGRGAG